jgi:predicted ATP-grasp superfamily ATP-dependent carboligase
MAVICTKGSGVNALAILRSLGRLGVTNTLIVCGGTHNLASRSRYCCRCALIKSSDGRELAEMLISIAADRRQKPLLFVDNDAVLSLLAPYARELSLAYHFTSPLDRMTQLNDKTFQSNIAQRIGLSVPRSWIPQSWDEVEAIESEFSGKVVAKPLLRHFVQYPPFKVELGKDASALVSALKKLLPSPKGILIQEFVEGPDTNLRWSLCYRASHSVACHVATGMKWRQTGSGSGGVGSVMLAQPDALVREATIRLATALDYRGILGVEFKYSAVDGKLYFIEINARTEAFHSLGRKLGVDLPALAYRDLACRVPMEEETSGCDEAIFWINLEADLRVLWRTRKNWRFKDAAKPYLSRKEWAVFAGGDPVPWLHAVKWTGVTCAESLLRELCKLFQQLKKCCSFSRSVRQDVKFSWRMRIGGDSARRRGRKHAKRIVV